MDVHPLAARIEQDAKTNAQTILSEARARMTDLQATSDDTIEDMQRDARKRAQVEGDTLEANMRRLGALEARKGLLAMKRQLIDESFDLALQQLHSLPAEQLRQLFMEQLVRYAQGEETVYPGSVSPAFFDPGFIQEANQRLTQSGRPGKLQAGKEPRPGVCGLVLTLAGTQTHLTTQAMMALHRPGLEGEVAQLVCEDLT